MAQELKLIIASIALLCLLILIVVMFCLVQIRTTQERRFTWIITMFKKTESDDSEVYDVVIREVLAKDRERANELAKWLAMVEFGKDYNKEKVILKVQALDEWKVIAQLKRNDGYRGD